MSSPDYSQAVKDIIDGLGDSPTADEIYHAVKNYSIDHVVAASAAAAKAGGGGGGGSQPDKFTITAAEILALDHTTGLQLYASPGPNKAIIPSLVVARMLPGNVPFADGDLIDIGPGDFANGWYDPVLSYTAITGESDVIAWFTYYASSTNPPPAGPTDASDFIDQAWFLKLDTATPFTAGNGTIKLAISKTIADFS